METQALRDKVARERQKAYNSLVFTGDLWLAALFDQEAAGLFTEEEWAVLTWDEPGVAVFRFPDTDDADPAIRGKTLTIRVTVE